MHKKLSILIGLFLIVSFSMAQETTDYGFTLVRGTAGYSNGYEANAPETAEPKVAYVNYIEKGKKGEIRYGDFTDVELNDYIEKGNEIDVTDGRIEILLKGGGVIRLDRNTRVVFVVLNEESIIIRVWGNNVYVEKGELEVGVKSENKELNLIIEEWYLTESTKGFKKFKKWNSKRGEEFKQRYLSEEADYDFSLSDNRVAGYHNPYDYGYDFSLRRYGRYYPYYDPYFYPSYGFRRYGRYGYWARYLSLPELVVFVGLSILFDLDYCGYYGGYYGGWYGRYYPNYYGGRYQNYNFYNHSRGRTVIHKNQLSRGRNTAKSITRNISSSSFKTSFSTVSTKSSSKSTGRILRKSTLKHSQFLGSKQRTKITVQERKKIQKRTGAHGKKNTFSAMDYLKSRNKSRNSVKKDSYGYPSSRKVSTKRPTYKSRSFVKKKPSSFIGRIYKNVSGSSKSVKNRSSRGSSRNSSRGTTSKKVSSSSKSRSSSSKASRKSSSSSSRSTSKSGKAKKK